MDSFCTHRAKLTKTGKSYNLQLVVKAKHDVLLFKPLKLSIGPIIDSTFKAGTNIDTWTYVVKLKDLKQLENDVSETFRLSMPTANINDKTFKAWLKFNVKVASSDTDKMITSTTQKNTVSSQNTNQLQKNNSSLSENKVNKNQTTSVQDKKIKPAASSLSPASLIKYRISPEKGKYADIALINYPILPTVLIFLFLDIIVITAAIWLRKKEVKRNHEKIK